MTALDQRRAARAGLRDRMANSDTRPPSGAQSSVSQDALTQNSQQVAAMVRNGPAGLSPDLAKNVQAASLPPVAPGQVRTTGTSGARNETPRPERGTDRGGNAL